MFPIEEKSVDRFFEKCIDALDSDDPKRHLKVKKSLKQLNDWQQSRTIVSKAKKLNQGRPCSAIVRNYALYQLGEINKKEEIFPFSIDWEHAGEICEKKYTPRVISRRQFTRDPEAEAGFVVTLPMLFNINPDRRRSYKDIDEIIKKFEGQSFASSSKESKIKAPSHLRLVIGGNRRKSLDKKTNKAFKKYLKNMPEDIVERARIFGFFWEPRWKNKANKIYAVAEVRPYYECFYRLKPNLAREVEKPPKILPTGFKNRLIPYQGIRETIKDHEYTRSAFRSLRRVCSDRPLYMSVIDADLISLRIDGLGLFSHYHRLINDHPEGRSLEFATTGYAAPSKEEAPLPFWAIRMDMRVREAMAKVFPTAPYPPEPNFIVLKPEDKDHVPESFYVLTAVKRKRSRKQNQSNGNEGRNFVDHLITDRRISQRDMRFISEGSLPIVIPQRFMTTQAEDTAELGRKNIYRAEKLSGLRGIRQTHYRPLEGFAKNIAHALSKSNDNIKSFLTKIFKPFDPIALCRDPGVNIDTETEKQRFNRVIGSHKINAEVMKEIVELYRRSKNRRKLLISAKASSIIEDGAKQIRKRLKLHKDDEVVYETVLRMRAKLLIEGLEGLIKERLRKNEVYKCVKVAAKCGKAMCKTLEEIYSN